MGSGGIPIKFGPEWLRNLGEGTTQSGAPSSGSGASDSTSGTAGTGRNNLQTTGSPQPGSTTQPSLTAQNLRQNNTSRIHLANLRYGREEMLALYDRLVAAPESIKQFELLYQQRGKPPCALNVFKDGQNTPEEGASGGQIGGTSLSSYSGRSRGNGVGTAYTKKPNTVRPNVTNMGRVWNKVRTDPAQGGSVPPDTQELRRSWNASNAAGTSRQATTEQSGWASTKLFKNRRQIRSTNWRQSGREEGGEWRSQDHAARFPNSERDWPERSLQDRPQSWSANRRPWSEQQSDEIPEWANDNADAGAGTFDSSGAFHGCSDEVRPQEQTFPLPRYQASSTLMRSSSDEAAEQWWSSEKAKKLSPKRLISGRAQGQASTSNDTTQDEPTNNEQLEVRMPEPKPENDVKPKPFDALVRRDLDVGNENNNLSNFQSVMISQNNTLRQKHQNIVSSPTTGTSTQPRNSFPIFQGKYDQMKQKTPEQGNGNQDNLFEGPLTDNMPIKNATSNMPRAQSEDTSVLAPGQQGGPPNLQLQTGGAVAGIEAQSIPSATKIPNPVQNSIPPLGLQNSASGTTLNMQSNDMMMPPLHGLPQMMSNTAFNPGMNMPSLPQRSNMMDAFQQNVRSHIMTSSNAPSASVPYLGQNNNAMMASNRQPTPEMAACMFPPQGLPRHAAQPPPLNSVYGGPSMMSEAQNFLADLWYYEDPEKKIQGPFSSKEMWNWYIAGYFQPSLIVRRAFETTMRPLADYGPMPFLKVGMNSQVNCPRAPDTFNPQAGFGLGETSRVWSPAPHTQNIIWMEPTLYPESSVNNLPRYFWDVEPPAMPSILPKEMKTEDEILAQILSSQNISLPRAPSSEEIVKPVPLSNVHSMNANNVFVKPPNVPDLSQLPVIRPEMIPRYSPPTVDIKSQLEELAKEVPVEADADSPKVSSPKEVKIPKPNKNESEKCKNKETNGKNKSKKTKEEKKEDNGTVPTTDEEATKLLGKRSVESSPSKASKEVKVLNKKDLEKEKKELMKDGFTIVKGAEKNNNKEIKKKVEEAKAAEEAARKKKEEDAMFEADESRKLSLATIIKKQDQQQQKQASEFVAKKAPWSAVATQATATDKGALTLAVIQRLEREKKLEQIKEQQQMMHIIAQQQAATLAREQEVQAGLGWATKKNANPTSPPNLAEIQSKTRRQAAAAPVTPEIPDEKSQASPAVANHVPWGNSSNGGFWDSPSQSKQNADPVKSEPSKPVEPKSKAKTPVPAPAPSKKKTTPVMEFDAWCSQALGLWSSKIDVPTFMVFLKDIESPYEVKDYVKCYLGESKESSDFSRQFLERRSKLLRVGTVTPSDDLCSPALAINPRNNSTSDYQEVKGKGKKTKKNKMMKVDARILGFSVTAAEDRINVGDIDTA